MSLQSQFAFLPISRSLCNIARCKTNQTLSLVDIPKKSLIMATTQGANANFQTLKVTP